MKAKTAKRKSTKPSVKVRDLKPKGDLFGGMSDYTIGKGRWMTK